MSVRVRALSTEPQLQMSLSCVIVVFFMSLCIFANLFSVVPHKWCNHSSKAITEAKVCGGCLLWKWPATQDFNYHPLRCWWMRAYKQNAQKNTIMCFKRPQLWRQQLRLHIYLRITKDNITNNHARAWVDLTYRLGWRRNGCCSKCRLCILCIYDTFTAV